jgi:hypothetical protein
MPHEALTTKEVAVLLELANLDQWMDAQPRGGESSGEDDDGR